MLVRITDWHKYLGEGEKYLAWAQGAAARRRDVFTPNIIYNVTAMAIEKLLMGLLMYHGTLAENHTMRDLLDAVERVAGPQPQFAEDFRYLDAFQDICSLEAYRCSEPTWEDIPRILACGAQVSDFVSRSGIRAMATN
ncbi:MAG: hypothetical protein ACYC9M_03150 [Desulfobulbaceae bacterium]